MKVLLLKDAKEDDGGQDPYIRVSAGTPGPGKLSAALPVKLGAGSAKTEELAQNKLLM